MQHVIEPPAGYTGVRIGDASLVGGEPYVCVALIRSDHQCARGELCPAAWHVAWKPVGDRVVDETAAR